MIMGQERFCHFCKETFDAGNVDGYGFTAVIHDKCNHISSCEGDLGIFEPNQDGTGGTAHWSGEAAQRYLKRKHEFSQRS